MKKKNYFLYRTEPSDWNEIFQLAFLSEPADWSQNSHCVLCRYLIARIISSIVNHFSWMKSNQLKYLWKIKYLRIKLRLKVKFLSTHCVFRNFLVKEKIYQTKVSRISFVNCHVSIFRIESVDLSSGFYIRNLLKKYC